LCGVETWELGKIDSKYLGSVDLWCWRRMEKVSWAVRMETGEVGQRVKE
jgi:hypothetical protein